MNRGVVVYTLKTFILLAIIYLSIVVSSRRVSMKTRNLVLMLVLFLVALPIVSVSAQDDFRAALMQYCQDNPTQVFAYTIPNPDREDGLWSCPEMLNLEVEPVVVDEVVPPSGDVKNYEQMVESVEKTRWISLQPYEDGRGVEYEIDGETWYLPLETQMAREIDADGRLVGVEPLVSGPDAGYCKEGQRGCTNQTMLYRIAVPAEFEECVVGAIIDIPMRFFVVHQCGQPVPALVGMRYNDVAVTGDEEHGMTLEQLKAAYAGLAEGQPAIMYSSELPVEANEFSLYAEELGEAQPFQYSCWFCTADTGGANALAVPLVDVTHDGPNVAPLGKTSLPGVSLKIDAPTEVNLDWVYRSIVMMPEVGEARDISFVFWIGVFDEELSPLSAQGIGGGSAGENPIGSAVVTAAKLNVRSGPGVTYPVVTTVVVGEVLDVFATDNGWLQIGQGWIATGEGYSTYTPNS